MACGSWCVYYKDRDINSICKYCSDRESKSEKWEFEKIDFKKMAEGLAIKEGRIIFFAHSKTTYNTKIEASCLNYLQNKYPNYYLINPRDIPIEENCDFETCMARILPELRRCSKLIYYKDNSDAPSIDIEIAEARKLGISIIELTIGDS